MEWNVYYYSINKKKMMILNIFDHDGFAKGIDSCLKKYSDKHEFAEAIEKELFYYFWSRAEYEILMKAWYGGNGVEEIKVDIYSQVMINFDRFIDYLWRFREKNKCTFTKVI